MKKLLYSDSIITMNNRDIEAIGYENGQIQFIGNYDDGLTWVEDGKVMDCKGKTILPAFIDAHSHYLGVANAYFEANLSDIASLDELKEVIVNYMHSNHIAKGQWVMAKGFDPYNVKEQKYPTLAFLDSFTKDNPLVITHVSNHTGMMNSLALQQLGISDDSVAVDGGVIEKVDGHITGYLEENSFIEAKKQCPAPNLDDLLDAMDKAQGKYASYGITYIQEGMFDQRMIGLYQMMMNQHRFYLDITPYVDFLTKDDIESQVGNWYEGLHEHVHLGGYKIFIDGSPQAKTAYMSKPYENSDSCGVATLTQQQVDDAVHYAMEHNRQIIAHCNGDQAAQMFINACITNQTYTKDIRPVMIHAQCLRKDQLDTLKYARIIPSFFASHVYYWGDVHRVNLGKRAESISCMNSCKEKGIRFSMHTDSPVIEPNLLEAVHIAVNRKTKSGYPLGLDQCIDVYTALKAITVDAAYQYHQEQYRGVIDLYKVADFVILDQNPLTVDSTQIKDIHIAATIKNGEVIYQNDDTLTL